MVSPLSTRTLALMAGLRAQGLSYHAIAAALNQRGHAAPRGGRWYGNSVRQTLNHPLARTSRINTPAQRPESPDKALFDIWNAGPCMALVSVNMEKL